MTESKSPTIFSRTGSSPYIMPNLCSIFLIYGICAAIFYTQAVIAPTAGGFLEDLDFGIFYALASAITYSFNFLSAFFNFLTLFKAAFFSSYSSDEDYN
jgi:hypothetical protein